MTTEVNEFDGDYGRPSEFQLPTSDMPPEGMEITTDVSPDGSIAIGAPAAAPGMDPKSVYIYANSINPVSSMDDSNIVAFDIVFSVSCSCPDTGTASTYQVVKRIGIDKMKMADAAKSTTPISIVEAKQPEPPKPSLRMSTDRFKALAGLK